MSNPAARPPKQFGMLTSTDTGCQATTLSSAACAPQVGGRGLAAERDWRLTGAVLVFGSAGPELAMLARIRLRRSRLGITLIRAQLLRGKSRKSLAYVRRAKALAPSGCETRPANCRSSRKQSERLMEVTTWTEAL